MAMLEVKNLGISFGGLRAVDSLDMTIEKGELYGLIGPNGGIIPSLTPAKNSTLMSFSRVRSISPSNT